MSTTVVSPAACEMPEAEFFPAIIKAADGIHVDPRLVPSAAAPGMRTDVDSLGGFLCPTTFTERVLTKAYNTGEILKRCVELETGGRNRVFSPIIDESDRSNGSRFGGMTIYRVGETGTTTDSKPAVGGEWRLLHKLVGLIYCSNELVEDYPELLPGFLETVVRDMTETVINKHNRRHRRSPLSAALLIDLQAGFNEAVDRESVDIAPLHRRIFA